MMNINREIIKNDVQKVSVLKLILIRIISIFENITFL
jgi:hypothetical protein